MKSNDAVADCACIGETIDKDKLIVVAYVILQPNQTATPDELLKWAHTQLAAYKAPKRIYLVNDFPRTKNGKILRRDIAPSMATRRSG
jgi:acyl-coenzyme A synthetase/AMP-(fatty) acid ligase